MRQASLRSVALTRDPTRTAEHSTPAGPWPPVWVVPPRKQEGKPRRQLTLAEDIDREPDMDKAEFVAKQLHHLAPDRREKDVISAIRMIDNVRVVNPSPAFIQGELTETLSRNAPFTQLEFIEEAVTKLSSRS
ncbi:hypothetical protein DL991_41095 [Amycolatopsis sp. WAC 01375]|nr:hypothetical protein DL991_41095 [Amycolatopsis sp. WAC 01375]